MLYEWTIWRSGFFCCSKSCSCMAGGWGSGLILLTGLPDIFYNYWEYNAEWRKKSGRVEFVGFSVSDWGEQVDIFISNLYLE